MTPLETLKAARQLITDPAKWTQGSSARTSNGVPISTFADDAVCWCALGAIGRSNIVDEVSNYRAHQAMLKQLGGSVVSVFNDTHTHAEVLGLFDAAIAELEGV